MSMADLITRLRNMSTEGTPAESDLKLIRDSLIEICTALAAVRVQSNDTHNDLEKLQKSIDDIKERISN